MKDDLEARLTHFYSAAGEPLAFGPVEGCITDSTGRRFNFNLLFRFQSGTSVPHVPPIIRFEAIDAGPGVEVTGEIMLRGPLG